MNERKIRVLHVGIDSHLGGIETYLLKIATYIDKEKYQFDFLAFKGSEPCFRKELEELGCHFFYIEPRRKNYMAYLRDLNALYDKEDFDIVHCHLNSLSCIEPCMIALKKGYKVIVHSRNAGNIVSLKSRILHKMNYYCLPKKKIYCVAVSDFAGQWMFGKKGKFTVLNNGLNVERYKFSETSRNKIRKELKLSNEQEVIIHIGAFRTQKNHDFLIDVFKEYLKDNPTSVLILVGDGPLKEKIHSKVCELKIDKNIVFLGQRSDIPELLSAADKFFFPSYYEGFPNALLEAEASGLYCVVSDTITRQAMLSNMCYSVALKDPITKWTSALGRKVNWDRNTGTQKVKQARLDISGEMQRLDDIYIKIINSL